MKIIQNDVADKFRLMMLRKGTPDEPWEQLTIIVAKDKIVQFDFVDGDKTKLLLTLK